GERGIRSALWLRERIRLRRDGTSLRKHESRGRRRAGSDASRDRDLRAAPERTRANHRRRLPGARRRLECEAQRPARAHGTAPSSLREPQPLWAPAVLHAARVGVEGQSERRVRELAPQGVVRIVHAESLSRPSAKDLVFFSFAPPADADPIKYALVNAMFDDGGQATGYVRSDHGDRPAESVTTS